MGKTTLMLLVLLLCISSAYAEKSGKEAYKLSCVQCHGENGAGGKAFLQGPNLTILKKEYFTAQFKAILDGKRKGPGTVNMLKILTESKLSDKEIQAAADYAMKLPEARANHMKFGKAKEGQAKYGLCIACHGDKGQGYVNPGLPAPRLRGQADFYLVDQLKSFKAKHRGGDSPGGMQMQAMVMTLATEDDMKNVAAYIRSLEPKPVKVDIADLTFKVYQGKWQNLPNFSKLKHAKDGSLPKGLMDIKASEMKDNFAMVFEGSLQVPKDGSYSFSLSSDDGSKLYIDGKLLNSNDGIHPPNKVVRKKLKLKKGSVPIKVEFFEAGGGEELNVSWSGPGVKNRPLSTTGGKKGKKGGNAPPIPLEPKNGEAIVLRNFISDTTARSIAVGYPEKTHVTFNASNMSLVKFWSGPFLDAGAMWNGRGTNYIYSGENTVKVSDDAQFAFLPNADSQWPQNINRNSNVRRTGDLRFRGYKLDKARYPTFMYSLKEVGFEDYFKPIDADGSGISREITITQNGNSESLWFRIAMGDIKENAGLFDIEGNYLVKAEGAKIRNFGNTKELMVPVKFESGKATIKLSYLSNKGGK